MNIEIRNERSDHFCTRDADAGLKAALSSGELKDLRQWCRDNPDKIRFALDWIHPHQQVLRELVEREIDDLRLTEGRRLDISIHDGIKALKEPHWTVLPGFFLTAAGVVLAGLAAWFGWLAVRPPQPVGGGLPPSSLSTPLPATPP
jgi:hypothetical protein